MDAQYDPMTIIGRPTLVAHFTGEHAAAPILAALTAAGHPTDDVNVLLRPAGTDVVEDLTTGDRAAGQSADARRGSAAGSTTLVLLHPAPAQVEAVRAALTGLGATQIDYEPETIYTGEQSVHEVLGEIEALAHVVHEELIEDEARATQPPPTPDAKR